MPARGVRGKGMNHCLLHEDVLDGDFPALKGELPPPLSHPPKPQPPLLTHQRRWQPCPAQAFLITSALLPDYEPGFELGCAYVHGVWTPAMATKAATAAGTAATATASSKEGETQSQAVMKVEE